MKTIANSIIYRIRYFLICSPFNALISSGASFRWLFGTLFDTEAFHLTPQGALIDTEQVGRFPFSSPTLR